jgi:hypothetical protein
MVARDLLKFPHEVGHMPYRDVCDLVENWRQFPPVHVLARALVPGFKPEEREADMSLEQLQALHARATRG